MVRIIVFLIRIHLGLKKYESFRFKNQKTNAIYYFTPTNIMKLEEGKCEAQPSNVKLNWLLDPECKKSIVTMMPGW